MKLSHTILLLAALGGAPALAHAMLTTASPSPGAAVASPATIELNFSEELAPSFSGFTITHAGAPVALKAIMAEKGNTSLSATPSAPLAAGTYEVQWHSVASDDGHRMTGKYIFTVR